MSTRASVSALQEIASYLPILLRDGESLSQHPWAMTRPGLILPRDLDDIRSLVITYQEKIQDLQTVMRAVFRSDGHPGPQKRNRGLTSDRDLQVSAEGVFGND